MPKPSRRRSDKVVSMPIASTANQPSGSTQDDIARRAYELYCERDRQDGHDLEDWLQAERELAAGRPLDFPQSA